MQGAVVAVVLALAVASCGSGDDVRSSAAPETTRSTAPSPGTEPAEAAEASGWCSSWHGLIPLIEGPDPDPAVFEAALEAARTDAPAEIRDAVDWMVEGYEAAIAGDEDQLAGPESIDLGAIAAIVSWGHEACGDPPPLCTLWPSYKGAVAVVAFSDMPSDEQDELAREYGSITFGHFPEELASARADLEAFAPPYDSDDFERAAEEAHDEVDAWVERSCAP